MEPKKNNIELNPISPSLFSFFQRLHVCRLARSPDHIFCEPMHSPRLLLASSEKGNLTGAWQGKKKKHRFLFNPNVDKINNKFTPLHIFKIRSYGDHIL